MKLHILLILTVTLLTSCNNKSVKNSSSIVSNEPIGAPVNCEGAPDNAVLSFSKPFNNWALIFCTPEGHAVAAVDGYVWLTENTGKPYFLKSYLLKSQANQRKHENYFVNHGGRQLVGQQAINVNKMLKVGYSIDDTFTDIYQLDVLTKAGYRYNIFFYINNNIPKYVLGCVDSCNTSVLMEHRKL